MKCHEQSAPPHTGTGWPGAGGGEQQLSIAVNPVSKIHPSERPSHTAHILQMPHKSGGLYATTTRRHEPRATTQVQPSHKRWPWCHIRRTVPGRQGKLHNAGHAMPRHCRPHGGPMHRTGTDGKIMAESGAPTKTARSSSRHDARRPDYEVPAPHSPSSKLPRSSSTAPSASLLDPWAPCTICASYRS